MGAGDPQLTGQKVLQGKRAIITGASRGLGAAIAEAMWREGADLLLVARSAGDLRSVRDHLIANRSGAQCVNVLAADLGGASAPRAVMAEARRLWTGLDVLVNSAGIIGPVGMLIDNDWSEWQRTINVNLLAPVELCKLSVEWMLQGGVTGSIINISGGGATGPRPYFSSYATAKCALVRFSETLAAELADAGIRVNCVAPGPMNTRMLQDTLEAGAERVGREEFEKITRFAGGAASDPRVAADLAVYLASNNSCGITGKLVSAIWDPWQSLHEHVEELRTTDIYTLRRIVPQDRGRVWSHG